MSKLHQLIQELCPDGVEYRRLGELSEIGTGSGNTNEGLNKGLYPFFVRSQIVKKKNTYEFDETAIITSGDGVGVGKIYHYIEGKYALHQRAYRIHVKEKHLSPRFLYYYMRTNFYSYIMCNAVHASVTSIRRRMLDKFEIPLPPLPVQQEIVRILDTFTQLETELEAKLERELELRKKQYEYYRDQLIGFENNSKIASTKTVLLKDLAFYPRKRISSSMVSSENYVGVDNLLQNKCGKISSNYVPVEGALIEYLAEDILIGNIRPYLKKIWHASNGGGTNGDVLVIRPKDEVKSYLVSRYLYHVLSSDSFFYYDLQHSKGAKMPRGDKKAILNFPIPLPPLEEQKRIVEILDRFSTLTSDISVGLPAEIAARRKQYEYYRDKLLTFREKDA